MTATSSPRPHRPIAFVLLMACPGLLSAIGRISPAGPDADLS